MSQYINSFLIEPVVRQARRFSRPNNEVYLGRAGEEEAGPHHAEIQTAPTTGSQEDSSALLVDTPYDDTSGAPSRSTEAGVLTTLNDTEHNEQRPAQEGENGATRIPVGEWNSQLSRTAADIQAFQEGDETSANPLFAAERFRSPASSISSARSLIESSINQAEGAIEGPRGSDIGGRTPEDGVESRPPRDNMLPADDGMGEMRQRIIAIQRTDSTSEVKARLVHDLMVEKHNTSQQSLNVSHAARAHSPISIQSSDRPFTPSSPKSLESLRQTISPPTSSGSGGDSTKQFYLTAEDLKPTYYEKPTATRKDGLDERRSSDSDEESRALGCAHYKRNIKLQCSACHRWYTCRFCHDAVEDHMLNRRETKNMLCMLCGCAQAASEACIKCGERGAWYYCDVCKLWDDDPNKSIYHCNDCGICRVGQGLGKDFFHCKTCCVCMSISIRDTHRCIERSTDCDCPICGEYMFTSPQTVVFMRCGHSIHHRCYHEHMKTSYRCPICNRSIVNMEWQFSRLERAIEAQPMPEEFQDTKALVYCNDCNAKTSVRYHWLGLKCAVCDSYNTAQLQLLSGPDPSGADFAEAPLPGAEDRTLPSNAAPPQISPSFSRPHSPTRGRARHHHHHQPSHSRSGISAPPSSTNLAAVAVSLASSQHRLSPPSRAHSATPGHPTATTFPFSSPASDSDDDDDTEPESSDAEDSLEEYDEVDFWGGESPSSVRQNNTSSPPLLLLGRQGEGVTCSCREGLEIPTLEGEDGSEEDGDDSEDEGLVGVDVEDDDDDDEEEGGGPIEFELIGHR